VGTEGSAVAIGIDAAVVADHQVVVRRRDAHGPGTVLEEFRAAPTLVGMERLAKRLSVYPGAVAVAEPTSMTWLPLALALGQAGCSFALVGNRHAGRLRGALAGKNKSDVIDAEVLSRAGELFALPPARIPDAAELALRRAVLLRHKAVLDANRARRRLLSQARWAYPDVWIAFGRSWATALAVLGRWPHLRSLGRARLATLTDAVAAHTRGVGDAGRRAERIRAAAQGWVSFWEGHLDLDALEWETRQLLADIDAGDERRERAQVEAIRRWEGMWGDDPVLLSVPGMGPRVAPTVRAFWGDGRQFTEADEAQAYVGVNPSNWSSGLTAQPSRAITKEGPAALRLAFYQAANVARTLDPQLAAFYRKLMVERGHCHAQANCAVARKLVARTWCTITAGSRYELRDLDGTPVTRRRAKELAASLAVPEVVRRRSRARSTATRRGRLTR
jgi:transposase